MSHSDKRDRTIATHGGNRPFENQGVVNPPVYRASTILFERIQDVVSRHKTRFETNYYGRYGTQTHRAFLEAFCALEGSQRGLAVSSGIAAVCTALLSFLMPGDHLLMVDTAYEPTRLLCDRFLRSMGISTTYYDPMIGSQIRELIQPNTKVVYLESPGSLTFDVQDVAAITAAARDKGCISILDNTWATPMFFKPPAHGVDIAVYAATKYICGHSDMMMGVITMRESHLHKVGTMGFSNLGHGISADDAYMALRGLRSLHARLAQHQETALTLAYWLEKRPEVERVFHPALPNCAGHANWKRDFTGSSGLFSFALRPASENGVSAMMEGFRLFKMGFSWGGYESLALLVDVAGLRTATPWPHSGRTIRLHAGLEDPADLIDDLESGFARLGGA
jgi:cystathionine beta-lyase